MILKARNAFALNRKREANISLLIARAAIVLARVDDARKPNTACMAFEAVAFKSARVDAGSRVLRKYYLRATRRTRDELRIQYRFLSPPLTKRPAKRVAPTWRAPRS